MCLQKGAENFCQHVCVTSRCLSTSSMRAISLTYKGVMLINARIQVLKRISLLNAGAKSSCENINYVIQNWHVGAKKWGCSNTSLYGYYPSWNSLRVSYSHMGRNHFRSLRTMVQTRLSCRYKAGIVTLSRG